MNKFKVIFPYFLECPVKVVAEKANLLGLFGWIFQRGAVIVKKLIKPENIIISERIIEVPSVYYLLASATKIGDKILEIGHVHSLLSLELANLGYKVTAIDLREYPFTHKILKSIKGDFLEYNFKQKFNCVITVSTIEHFGFNKRYGGGENKDKGLDIKAFEKIYNILESGGKLILTVPYAAKERTDIWFKTYTRKSIEGMLLNFFIISYKRYFVRDNNSWTDITLDKSRDPDFPYDGVVIFLLTKK